MLENYSVKVLDEPRTRQNSLASVSRDRRFIMMFHVKTIGKSFELKKVFIKCYVCWHVVARTTPESRDASLCRVARPPSHFCYELNHCAEILSCRKQTSKCRALRARTSCDHFREADISALLPSQDSKRGHSTQWPKTLPLVLRRLEC